MCSYLSYITDLLLAFFRPVHLCRDRPIILVGNVELARLIALSMRPALGLTFRVVFRPDPCR